MSSVTPVVASSPISPPNLDHLLRKGRGRALRRTVVSFGMGENHPGSVEVLGNEEASGETVEAEEEA